MKLKLVTSMCNSYEQNSEMEKESDVNEHNFANYIEIIFSKTWLNIYSG